MNNTPQSEMVNLADKPPFWNHLLEGWAAEYPNNPVLQRALEQQRAAEAAWLRRAEGILQIVLPGALGGTPLDILAEAGAWEASAKLEAEGAAAQIPPADASSGAATASEDLKGSHGRRARFLPRFSKPRRHRGPGPSGLGDFGRN